MCGVGAAAWLVPMSSARRRSVLAIAGKTDPSYLIISYLIICYLILPYLLVSLWSHDRHCATSLADSFFFARPTRGCKGQSFVAERRAVGPWASDLLAQVSVSAVGFDEK